MLKLNVIKTIIQDNETAIPQPTAAEGCSAYVQNTFFINTLFIISILITDGTLNFELESVLVFALV